MFKKLLLTSFLLFVSLITIYPSKKENTSLFDYCYSLEKIISRNSLKKTKNISENFKNFAKDITLFGTDKTKGALVNKIINQYKKSKNLLFVTIIPTQLYCLGGYWIEEVKPGMFESIILEKGKQKINEIKDMEDDFDEFLRDANSEYKNLKKDFDSFFNR